MKRPALTTLAALTVLAIAAAPASANDALLPDAAVAPEALGDVVARARRGATEYIALMSGGIAIVDHTDEARPRVVGRLLDGASVSALVIDGDTLWAMVLDERATTFSLGDPLGPVALLPASAASPTAGPPMTPAVPVVPIVMPTVDAPVATSSAPRRARVVEVSKGRVVFDIGTADGLKPGDRVRVSAQRLVAKPDLVKGGTTLLPSGETTAVVEVEDAEADRAMAVLGRGDIAVAGDVVEITDEPLSERLMLPHRAGFAWRVGFVARPFFSLGSIGGGALVDGYARYTFADLPLTLGVELTPLAANVGSDTLAIGGVAGTAVFTTDFFEVGLGAGALGAPGVAEPSADGTIEPTYGRVSIHQELRLGAIDGLHLAWRSAVYVEPPNNGQLRGGGFSFGMGRGELAVPVASRLSLFAAGAFGLPGYGFGEIGVRSLFFGTGGPGTLMMTTSLGGTVVGRTGGPAVAFGMEWRL